MGGARVNVIGEAGCTLRAVFYQFDLTPSEGCFGGLVFGGRGEVYLGIRRLATFAGSSKLTVPQATEQALCLGKKGGDLAPAAFSCWNFVQILGWQGLKSLRENSRIREGRGAHRRSLRSATPDFLLTLMALVHFMRLSLTERRTRGHFQCSVAGNPGTLRSG